MIGKTISHYRIVDKVGEGGMGVVYKAEDTRLHRTVALKFLPPGLIGGTQELARFILEARAAAALDHPNICTIYEIDESAEQPLIAMAYIEGRNLKEISAQGPLKLDDAVRYASQVARGLEEAHTKGVVHRDVKSANVVVSDKGHAIVMDFGLAKLQGQTKITKTGTTVGTVAYMSPEQARGQEVDHRSDIWSLGIVLYRMIAGRYPFESEHPSAVIYSITNEPHEPLTALRTGVPPDLERIVDKALKKDPRERYQSVSDMIVDLKAVRGQLVGTKTAVTGRAASTSRASRRVWLPVALVAVVVVAGFVAWRLAGGIGAPRDDLVTSRGGRASIAVLPLDNLSREKDQEYVADGMTEALIAELAQIQALRVISRTSVMRFKETTQPISEIAEALGVNTIIEGSVMQAGGRVRVTAQLIDARTDEHLWAQSYERDMSDVLALQSEVARAIASEVKVELTPGEEARLESSSKVDPRAYDLYMRGRYHWYRRTPSDLERALELFEQAVAIQPDWGLGYSALAQTYSVMAGWTSLPAVEAYPKTAEYAQKALELDPNLGSAWACLAGAEGTWRWNWDKAEAYFLKAIALEPNNGSTHQWYAEFLCLQGRFDEALDRIETAESLDPMALIMAAVKAWIYDCMGEHERGIAESERVISDDPDFVAAYYVIGDACRHAGHDDRAAEAYGNYYESIVAGAEQVIRDAYADGGMDAVTRAIINVMRGAGKTRYISPASMGLRFASLGEADSAMVWLERAYETHAYPIEYAATSPDCEPIHTDPRFIDLIKRIKLDHVKPAYARK